MNASVEISMYPLDADYIPPIEEFIERLNGYEGLVVRTNALSTQVFGDYDLAMHAVTAEIKRSGEAEDKVVFVMKVLNSDLSGWKQDDLHASNG